MFVLSHPSGYQWITPRELDKTKVLFFSLPLFLFVSSGTFVLLEWWTLPVSFSLLSSSFAHPLFSTRQLFWQFSRDFFSLHSALMARQSSGVQKGNISWKLERIHPCYFGMNWNLVPSAILISSAFWHSLFFCFLSPFFLRPTQPSSHITSKNIYLSHGPHKVTYTTAVHPDWRLGHSESA